MVRTAAQLREATARNWAAVVTGPRAPRRHRVPRGARAHLKQDPDLADVMERVGPFRLQGYAHSDLEALVRAIVYQQLSGKAAGTIYRRFLQLFPGGRYPSARAILARSDREIRGVGVSRGKMLAIQDLCRNVAGRSLRMRRFSAMEDDAIVEELVKVRGIGPWSAQMFLMFHLGRMDVWPAGDLGVQKGIQRLRRMRSLPSPRRMEREGRRFAPYRTVAAWYMWRLLELSSRRTP